MEGVTSCVLSDKDASRVTFDMDSRLYDSFDGWSTGGFEGEPTGTRGGD
jgi:hypothetical protein